MHESMSLQNEPVLEVFSMCRAIPLCTQSSITCERGGGLGSGFRFQGLGLRVQGAGFMSNGAELRVEG